MPGPSAAPRGGRCVARGRSGRDRPRVSPRLAVAQPCAQEAGGGAQRTAAPAQRHVPLEGIDVNGPDRLQGQAPRLDVGEERRDLPPRRPAGGVGQPAPIALLGDEPAHHGFIAERQARAWRPQTAEALQQVGRRGAEVSLGVAARRRPAAGRISRCHLADLAVVEAMAGRPSLQLDGHAKAASGLLDERCRRYAARAQIGQVGGAFLGQRAFEVAAENARIGEQRLEHGSVPPWERHATMSCRIMLRTRRRPPPASVAPGHFAT